MSPERREYERKVEAFAALKVGDSVIVKSGHRGPGRLKPVQSVAPKSFVVGGVRYPKTSSPRGGRAGYNFTDCTSVYPAEGDALEAALEAHRERVERASKLRAYQREQEQLAAAREKVESQIPEGVSAGWAHDLNEPCYIIRFKDPREFLAACRALAWRKRLNEIDPPKGGAK